MPAQVNADPDMLRDIEYIAAETFDVPLNPGQVVVFLMQQGISHVKHCGVNARKVNRSHGHAQENTVAHADAQQLTFEPLKAEGRTVERKKTA